MILPLKGGQVRPQNSLQGISSLTGMGGRGGPPPLLTVSEVTTTTRMACASEAGSPKPRMSIQASILKQPEVQVR
jgi:hypothetical protein